ncbi:MAG: LysM peptidoglycan-binding domain-containing protein [Anaerolineae bacterium]|nr:LysM peptidoglycan-binding domain-containing protein [Anaerolineae bacterium]
MISQRRGWKALGVALWIVAVLAAAHGAIQAQQPQELLRNGTFDTYYGTGGENVVPDGWALTANVPVRSAKQNWVFNEFPPFTHSWQVASSGYVFDMTAYQFVPGVRSGTRLRFSVYANLFTCDNDKSCITAETGRRVSQQESGARVRIGVDPQGGSNPGAPSVVWSQFISPFDRFEQLIIDFQSQNDNGVTVFMNATQSVGMLLNHVYFSQASLQLTGASAGGSGATEVPRFAPYVTPQGQQPDGSVVHVVRTGDTLASIAVAYGVPLAQIRELNNIPAEEYVIQIGQRLLIKRAMPNITYVIVTNTPTMDPNATWTATPSPTRSPTATATRRAGGGSGLATPRVIVITVNPSAPTATPTPGSGAMRSPRLPGAPGGERVAKVRPRPVQSQLSGAICALAYDDANKNRYHDADEPLLSGMILSLSQREQAAVTQITAADRALCFANLAPGMYEMVAEPPSNRGLTTPSRIRIELSPGAQLGLTFGAAEGFEPEPVRSAASTDANEAQASGAPTWLTDALANSGLIVLGLAGVVLFGGLAFVLFVRRH